MEHGWIVIGIGGATCSGKTTIALELHKRLPESELIQQDNYYYPMGSANLEYIEEIKHYNWDTLTAIDTDRMVKDIENKLGNAVCETKRILLVEGHLIYNIPSVASIFTRKYFVTVSKEVARFRRRTRRYKRYDQRYFDDYAWPLYEHHRDESFIQHGNFMMVDGDLDLNVNLIRIFEDIKKLIELKNDVRTSKDNLRVIIIEGTLVLNEPRIRDLCTLRYFFTLPYDVSKQRRHKKHYDHPDPPSNFDRIVWPQYLNYKAQLIDDPSITFIDSHENDVNAILHTGLRSILELNFNKE